MSDEQAFEHENPYEHSQVPVTKLPGSRSLVPPAWVWIVFSVFVLLIALVRIREVSGDRAVVNMLTLILAFLGGNVFSVWFVFLSGYSGSLRFKTVAGSIVAIVAFFCLFTIDHVTGEMIPVFRPRWRPPQDEQIEQAEVAEAKRIVDLQTTTSKDFPQLLGPNRNGRLAGPSLRTDWKANPPEPLWRQPIGAGWSGFVAVNGFAVTLEQRGEDELTTCYHLETGDLGWVHAERTRHSTVMGGVGPRSTPTIHQGKVYTLGATGILLCLDGATGEPVWQQNLLARRKVSPEEDAKAVAWGRSNSPLIVDDLLVVPEGGSQTGEKASLVAFNKETGELVWEAGDRRVSYSSPVLVTLAGIRQIVSVNEGNVSAHDPLTGTVLWQFDWPGQSNTDATVSNPQIIDESRLLLSKHYGKGCVGLELTKAEDGAIQVTEVWNAPRLLKTKFTNAFVYDGHAYGLSDGILECVDVRTGRRRWKKGRYGQGQILGVGNVILVQAEFGEVAMVDATPNKFVERARFQAIDGQTWNNLCLYGDLLLVRNSQEAACYRLPTK